jgi:hypothetical protein
MKTIQLPFSMNVELIFRDDVSGLMQEPLGWGHRPDEGTLFFDRKLNLMRCCHIMVIFIHLLTI